MLSNVLKCVAVIGGMLSVMGDFALAYNIYKLDGYTYGRAIGTFVAMLLPVIAFVVVLMALSAIIDKLDNLSKQIRKEGD